MKITFDILLYAFELFISYMFISYNFERKKSFIKTISVGFILFTIGAILLRIFANEFVNLIYLFLANLIFYSVFFRINIIEATVYSIVLETLMFTSEIICLYFYSDFSNVPTDYYKQSFTAFVIFAVVSKIIYFVFTQLFAYIIEKFKFKNKSSSRFLPLFTFPILTILLSVLFFRMSFENKFQNSYNILFIVLSIALIISNIYIFYYYQTLVKNEEELNQFKAEKHIKEINEKYFEVIEQSNNDMRVFSHNIKNHFMQIRNMDNVNEIREYVDKLSPDLEKFSQTGLSKNKMLDLILSKYQKLCYKKNLAINIDVKTSNLQYIDDVDLSNLLNNLLDNAVEAAEKSAERKIDIIIFEKNKQYDGLIIRNSCDYEPKSLNGVLQTTKMNKDFHGFGMSSINRVLKKYDAVFDWKYDKQAHIFQIDIAFFKS